MVYKEKGAESDDWQSLNKQLSARLRFAYQEGKYTDCAIRVIQDGEQEVFKAHKLVLGSSSCVFEAMFFGPLASDKPIVIDDISSKAFSVLLDYVYNAELDENLYVGLVIEAWYAAEKYQMKYLYEDCEKFLFEKTDGTNVGAVLAQARILNSKAIEDFCWDIIKYETDFDNTDLFETLSKELLLEVLDTDELSIDSELQLFQGIDRHCQLQCEKQNLEVTTANMRAFGQELLQKIRFLCFEPCDFVVEPVSSKLLTDKEKLALFANVANVKKLPNVMPLPAGFSWLVHKRKGMINCQQNIVGTISGTYATVSTISNFIEDDFKLARSAVFTLKISCQLSFAMNKICCRHDCEGLKRLRISNSNNKIICANVTCGSEFVLKKDVFFRANEWYNLEITLLRGGTCKGYRASQSSWSVSHYDQSYGSYALTLSSSSDHVLVKGLSIVRA